ncbi:hypothetical protein [Ktedonobacter sp. SOSP1-85]|uniref:hypothetical protein n=1 Tax=Ktedonobacter sp. SOSP1-85 TaxID=2778367 RepID=UPI001F45DF96|nr:hypothetical protein [Ktedonobacter sp. SOSP1-85]
MHRTWDLRSYTGDALALLTGRPRAYGYFHTERFLAEVAESNGAEMLTNALARWTTGLWYPSTQSGPCTNPSACFYVDGHRKPVYTDMLIPRGLVGRLSAILGCRALVLLHDARGHPLLATTHRGDHHLTLGLPAIVKRYEQETGPGAVQQNVVDREGMAVEFLALLGSEGRSIISVLRADQYAGLDSFTDVGDFVPLRVSKQGKILREVAPASITLPLPEQKGQSLQLRVALIRNLCHQVPLPPTEDEREYPKRWDADLNWEDRRWWDEGWQATPASRPATTPKLIPIVTTASTVDAVELAQMYIERWPLQENIIRDFLLPLGLDTNHGYSKKPVENSEVVKKRTALEKRLANVQRWAEGARKRSHNASKLYRKRCKLTKEQATELYRALNDHQIELEQQGIEHWLLRKTMKEQKALADAEIEKYQQRQWKAYHTSNQEFAKCEKYCREQREVLRALEDLTVSKRTMYELDNRKDQVMTVFKVALTNLVMWTRDHYFPTSFAQATWKRLAPFFHLPGLIVQSDETVTIAFRSFNDRQYNRDLTLLCERVNAACPHLPDGRRLHFSAENVPRPILNMQKQCVA